MSGVELGIRAAFRRPGSTLLLVATLAIGVGATTAVFSVLDAVLLRPPPYARPNELVELLTRDPDGSAFPGLDPGRAEVWTHETSLFSSVERYTDRAMLLGDVDDPANLRVTSVSVGLFPLLGVAPVVGRSFTADDARPDAPPTAIVSDEFRRKYLGDQLLARPTFVHLDEKPYRVVGVMPAWFRYPRGKVTVWLPMSNAMSATSQSVKYVARLRAPLDRSTALARFMELTARLERTTPRTEGWGVAPMFIAEAAISRTVRLALWVLAGAVGCVLLIACVNAANLLLIQGTARRREIGIRRALGATRAQIIRQLLGESLTFVIVAAVLGVGIAYWAVDAIRVILPPDLATFGSSDLEVNGRVLGFAVAASAATWLGFAIGPAVHASGATGSIASSERLATGTRGARRVRAGLVIAELALSLVLLAGAGLFIRSLVNLSAVDPGFDAAHTLFIGLSLPTVRYDNVERRAAALDGIRDALRAIPGVRDVAASSGLPPQAGVTFSSAIQAEGAPAPAKSGDIVIPMAHVDSNFFSTMGVAIVRGRSFNASEIGATAANGDAQPPLPQPVIVNAALAGILWPSADPLGKRFRVDAHGRWFTVVGVTAGLKLMGPDDRTFPYQIYYPRTRWGRATLWVSVAVRTSGDPRRIVDAARRAVHHVGVNIPIRDVAAGSDAFDAAMAQPRFVLALMVFFAAIAVALASVGVYGVLSHVVSQRTREIGIRMAVGAQASDIMRSFAADGVRLVVAGVTLGLIGVALSGHLIRALLFGLGPSDATVLVGVSLLLIAISMVALLVPASRASRVSPLVAIAPD